MQTDTAVLQPGAVLWHCVDLVSFIRELQNARKTHASGVLRSAVTRCAIIGMEENCSREDTQVWPLAILILLSLEVVNGIYCLCQEIASTVKQELSLRLTWQCALAAKWLLCLCHLQCPQMQRECSSLSSPEHCFPQCPAKPKSTHIVPLIQCSMNSFPLLVLAHIFSASDLDWILRRPEMKLWNY